jgi:hypothetical protein
MMYICAWQAPALPPERLISSRMTAPSMIPRPPPPYSSGISTPRKPACVSSFTKASGYSRLLSSSRQYSAGYFLQSSPTAALSWRCSSVSANGFCVAATVIPALPLSSTCLRHVDRGR